MHLTIEVPDNLSEEFLKQKISELEKKLKEKADMNLQQSMEHPTARERFERHFGEIDLGHPTGVDNEAIDADLTRTYIPPHERD